MFMQYNWVVYSMFSSFYLVETIIGKIILYVNVILDIWLIN